MELQCGKSRRWKRPTGKQYEQLSRFSHHFLTPSEAKILTCRHRKNRLSNRSIQFAAASFSKQSRDQFSHTPLRGHWGEPQSVSRHLFSFCLDTCEKLPASLKWITISPRHAPAARRARLAGLFEGTQARRRETFRWLSVFSEVPPPPLAQTPSASALQAPPQKIPPRRALEAGRLSPGDVGVWGWGEGCRGN